MQFNLIYVAALICILGAGLVASHTHEEFGTIGAAGALYGRQFHLTGGFDGYKDYKQHYKFNLLDAMGWERAPEQLQDLARERSLHSATVYHDFMFLFGTVPNVEIIGLATPEYQISLEDTKGWGPRKRVGHTVTLHNEHFYLFGGWDNDTNEYLNDLWIATVEGPEIKWTLIEDHVPLRARAFHSAILYQDSIYIFGGSSEGGNLLNDGWRYDITTGHWIRTWTITAYLAIPPAREGHGAAYFGDEAMYVWGGRGKDGFLNDMWRFDLIQQKWEKIFQGQVLPSTRAHFASVVIDEQWLVFGGLIGDETPAYKFWTPSTSFIDIYHPDDYSGEVWSFNFIKREWSYIGCMDVFDDEHWNGTEYIPPESCRSHHLPNCPNNCSGNGVCVADNTCVCRGQWTEADCSYNVCDFDKHRGFPLKIMDRALITETILKLSKELFYLRENLVHIRDRLPGWQEYLTCIRGGTQTISQTVVFSAGGEGEHFHNQCMLASLLPTFGELNDILIKSSDETQHFHKEDDRHEHGFDYFFNGAYKYEDLPENSQINHDKPYLPFDNNARWYK